MDLSTAAWHGFDGGCEAEGAPRVEEARAVEVAARKKSGGGRWVRETREVKASPQRTHKRCNQPGRKKRRKLAFLGAWFWVL
jgi:hypothetical protein